MESLPRPPWARAALVYALALTALEIALFALDGRALRAVVVADASIGWVVVLAALQGLRAVPFPPPLPWLVAWCFAAGHWLATVVLVFLAIPLL